MAKHITHSFCCIHCGNEGIPISRRDGSLRAKGHFKNLYCIHCRNTTRHLELHNDYEMNDFKEKFAKGEYVEYAKDDNLDGRVSSVWKEFLR